MLPGGNSWGLQCKCGAAALLPLSFAAPVWLHPHCCSTDLLPLSLPCLCLPLSYQVGKFIPEAIGKEIEKACQGIYPLQVRAVVHCCYALLSGRSAPPMCMVVGRRALLELAAIRHCQHAAHPPLLSIICRTPLCAR